MRRLLRLYPRDWRDRYGDEVSDLLARSDRPRRDTIDLVMCALSERLGRLARRRKETPMKLRVTAAVLVALGVAGAIWSTPQLMHGWREIPQHWWSAGATLLPLAAGLVLALVAWRSSRTDHGAGPPDLRDPGTVR